MMRISLESPALIAVRKLLSGSQPTQRGRNRSRKASGPTLRTEQLEPRTMLDAGMRAFLADLGTESDTGASTVDNLTYDQTPTLSGSVQGAATEVRLRIDGVRVATLPVTNGKWTYTVPAEEALPAGKHKIAVLPLDASGKAGKLSKALEVTIVTTPPTASTFGLAVPSDTGVKGDGKTIVSRPTIRGIAQPGRLVNVAIDGVFAGQVKSDAKTGGWLFKSPQLANGLHDITATAENTAGLKSAATSFAVTVNGQRTVMLDASSGQPVELMASHLLGQGSQGFVVTKVHTGTLQKWLPAQKVWKTIPAGAAVAANVLNQTTVAIRNILFTDLVRWTPSSTARGTVAAFEIIPLDKASGAIAPAPQAVYVPGKVVDAVIGGYKESLGTTISWKDPVDGGG
ncbi:MAG: Ig-like domain-containing protein, partial [Planctomycetota bacterium]